MICRLIATALLALSGLAHADLWTYAAHPAGRVTLLDLACQEVPAPPATWRTGVLLPSGGVLGRDFELVCWEPAGDGVTIHRFAPASSLTLPADALRYELREIIPPDGPLAAV